MKTLAISSGGDPLFVRDERGHDFEVEVVWVTDARHRRWAEDTESYWDDIWSKVYNGSPAAGVALPVPLSMTLRHSQAVLLVKPALRVFAAYRLPPLEERDAHERRARALVRLGGEVPDDEVVARRAETSHREWNRQHPKARPSHPSAWSPEPYYTIPGSMPRFTNIAAQRMTFTEASLVTAPACSVVTETVDAVQARRAEAMRRLQDPPEDLDASIQQGIKYLLDGLRSRPVL